MRCWEWKRERSLTKSLFLRAFQTYLSATIQSASLHCCQKMVCYFTERHSSPPPPPPRFFIYLNDQRMPSSMLFDQHSLVFSGLEYFWDILHWCNGSGPWSLKAKEKYCTFRYIALFAWPSVAWDNYPSRCKLRPPHPRTNALSIDWNCSPCVLPLALPPSRLPLAHTGNFLGLEISLLFCE